MLAAILYTAPSALDAVEGLDFSVLETSVLVISIHVTTHVVNSGVSVNCNQQYINIILATITIL